MVRRVVEEDVTDSPTVVERDDSWIGRTLVALVVIALLVVGAIWLVNNVGDDAGPRLPDNNTEVNVGDGDTDGGGDAGTDQNPLPTPS